MLVHFQEAHIYQLNPTKCHNILGIRIDATSYQDAVRQVISRAVSGDYGFVCAANVHMIIKAYQSEDFKKTVNNAVLVTPDGMPLVVMLRILGLRKQYRVYGPTLMKYICEDSARVGVSIGFYGSTSATLNALVQNLRTLIPKLKVGFTYNPPFRPLTQVEDEEIIKEINSSKIKILFVGLGCPKQERWMGAHHTRIKAVMIGVGAGFDFFAGTKKQAPKLMMQIGLEWLYRLLQEPKRLWKRYLIGNPLFLYLALKQLLKEKFQRA